MGLYLLNISVDTADPNPDHIPEDLSINDQESIVEIVVEKVAGYEDAIEEYDDNDSEDHNNKSNVKVNLFTHLAFDSYSPQPTILKRKLRYPNFEAHLMNGFYEYFTPPPNS